jgi:hypothetical protein
MTWLVVSVSTAGAAASLRVQVWRKLRSLGALYLQQSVCLLPATADVTRDARRLAARVRQGGGTARVLPMAFTDPAEEQAVITGLNAARGTVAAAAAALAAFENAALDAEPSGPAPAAGPGRSGLRAVDGP